MMNRLYRIRLLYCVTLLFVCQLTLALDGCFEFKNKYEFCCHEIQPNISINGSSRTLTETSDIRVTTNCTTYVIQTTSPSSRINITRVYVDRRYVNKGQPNVTNPGNFVIIEGLRGEDMNDPWAYDTYRDKGPLGMSKSNTITLRVTKVAQLHSELILTYEEVNPCLPDPCDEGLCKPNDDYTSYVCYTSCPEVDYKYLNSTIRWLKTPSGKTAKLPCPASAIGVVTRRCVLVDGIPEWKRPNLTGCVSKEMKRIQFKAEELKSSDMVTKAEILNVTDGIVSVLIGNVSESTLLPGDLAVATNAMTTVSEVVRNATDHPLGLEEIAKGYGAAFDEIVDPLTEQIWRQTEFDYTENKMKMLISSVEKLSSNVAEKREQFLLRRRREAQKYSVADAINVESRNIDFHINFRERIALCEESSDFNVGDNNSITLTSSVFAKAVRNSEARYLPIYTGNFKSIPFLLRASQDEQNKYLSENDTKSTTVFNSDIVSASILSVPEGSIVRLTKPVIIVFKVSNFSLWLGHRPKCAFMNMSETDTDKRWISEGCRFDKSLSNTSHVTCVCDHLTNFAVIMDVFSVEDKVDHSNSMILTYISYVGGGLSVIGCITTVIVFEFFRLRKERIRIHEQLAVSIMASQILFLAGIDRTENKYVCMGIAIALHYFLLTMFSWMLIEGFHLYVMLVRVFKKNDSVRKYSLLGWGLPLIVVAISAGLLHGEYGNSSVCWISNRLLLMAFVPVVGLVIVANTIVLLIVLRIMVKSINTRASNEDRSSVKSGLKAAVILLPLLGLTWTLGFFSINNKGTLVFTYLFTILNSLQGVFFFVFHCILSVDVQNAYERRSLRKSRSSLASTFNKRKDLINDLSSSMNTLITETSSTCTTRKSSPASRAHDRIHRDSALYDKLGMTRDKVNDNPLGRTYSDNPIGGRSYNDSPLGRSYSDGIPCWRRKNTYNQNGRGHIEDGYAEPPDILRNDYFFDDQQDVSYVIPYGRYVQNNNNDDTDFTGKKTTEDIYSKPIKRKSSSLPRSVGQSSNHVHFLDQSDVVGPPLADDNLQRKQTSSNLHMNEERKNFTKSFLEELQEKAAQIGIKDTDEHVEGTHL